MEIKKTLILSLLFLSCYYEKVQAFDIISMLSPYPDFSTFSNYLNQAQLVPEINSRQSITVLAVDNGGMGSLSGQGDSVVKAVMSIHVLLDYFDAAKFRSMAGGNSLTPTLYQTTGRAAGQQGFVNITISSGGAVLLGSGVEGSSSRVSLVKTVVAQPYNVSVLQISGLIFPKGVENSAGSTPPPPPPPPSPVLTGSPPVVSTNSTTPPSSGATNSTAPPSPVTSSTPPPALTNSTTPPSPKTSSTPPSPVSNSTTPPSPTTTASPPSPTTATPPSKSSSPTPVTAPSPKTAPKSPTVAPTTELASAPAPAPVAETKSGAVRFGGIGDGLILMIVAISAWLNLG